MTNIHNRSGSWLTRAKLIVLSSAMLIVTAATGLHADDFTEGYLYGRWAVNEKSCNVADAEYVVFDKDHTFVSSRSGKTEIIGFWKLNDEVLDLHMMTSPAMFADVKGQLVAYDGQYFYFKARMIPQDVKKNRFEVIGVLGEEIDRAYAVRCK